MTEPLINILELSRISAQNSPSTSGNTHNIQDAMAITNRMEAEYKNEALTTIQKIPELALAAARRGEYNTKVCVVTGLFNVNDGICSGEITGSGKYVYEYCANRFGRLRVYVTPDSYKQCYYLWVSWDKPISTGDAT